MNKEKFVASRGRFPAPHDRSRLGFGVAPILYMLGLIGVGAGVLFSSYSQSLKNNIVLGNTVAVRNDLEAATNTLAAISVLSVDGQKLCPPGFSSSVASVSDGVCIPNDTTSPPENAPLVPISLDPLTAATASKLPSAADGQPSLEEQLKHSQSDVDVGVLRTISGTKQLDPWGRYYVVCRWANATNEAKPAFQVISAGPSGKLDAATYCGKNPSASSGNFGKLTDTPNATNRASIWQTSVGTTGTVEARYSATGVVVDAEGNLTVPGNLNLTGTGKTVTLSSADVTMTSGDLSLVGGSVTLGSGSVTISAGNLTIGTSSLTNAGDLTSRSGTFTGALSVASTSGTPFYVDASGNLSVGPLGTPVFSVASATGNTSIGGTTTIGSTVTIGTVSGSSAASLNTYGAVHIATTVLSSTSSVPYLSVGTPTSGTPVSYLFSVDQAGAVRASSVTADSYGAVNATSINDSGSLTVAGTSSLGALSAGDATLGNVSASSYGAVNATSIIDSGDATIAGNLTVTGTINGIAGGGANLTNSTGVVSIEHGGTGYSSSNTLEGLLSYLGVHDAGNLTLGTLPVGRLPIVFASGAPSGTYNTVQVDQYGRVTAVSNVYQDTLSDEDSDSIALASHVITFTINGNIEGVWDSTGLTIGSSSAARATLDLGRATDALVLPVGTAGEQPATPAEGMIRYNSTTHSLESYVGVTPSWQPVATGATSQWVTSGSSIYYDGGNVGIGTTNPLQPLQVSGPIMVGAGSCGASTSGSIQYSGGDLQYCNGTGWVTFASGSSGSNVFGSGTANYLPVFTGTNTLGNSVVYQNSGSVGIGTTSPVSSLHVATGGLFAVTGTYGAGDTLPAGLTGAGTRMFFYPQKGAFRAGTVTGTHWDDTNIGDYSTAMGYRTIASGGRSTALGDTTTASGNYSTALGGQTIASGSFSTATGNQTSAVAYADTAIGQFNVGSGTAGSWVSSDPIFEIGIGTSSSNKANAVTVLKNGNVSIGRSASIPSTQSLVVYRNGTTPTIAVERFGYGNGGLAIDTTGNLLIVQGSYGTNQMIFKTSAPWDSDWASNGIERMRIDGSTGYVGIGTTGPVQTLQVAGPVMVGAGSCGATTAGSIQYSAGGDLQYCNGTAWVTFASGTGGGNIIGSGTANYLPVFTGTNSLGNSVVYQNSGNVGIGTTNPASALDVVGAINIGGLNALRFPTDSTQGASIAIGPGALAYQTASQVNHNVAIGLEVLGAAGVTSAATYNVGVGSRALYSNTSGHNNAGFGASAMRLNTTGYDNTALGYQALFTNSVGSNNTAVGYDALLYSTGSGNTAVGAEAMNSSSGINLSGGSNTAVGSSAMRGLQGGAASNTALGYNTGATLTTGSSNILLGANADVPSATQNNFLNIGNLIFGTGLTGTVSSSAGNVGIGTTSPAVSLEVNGIIRSDAGEGLSLGGDADRHRLATFSSSPMLRFLDSNNDYGSLGIGELSVGGTTFATTAPPLHGGIIEGNLGIGTTAPVSSLHVATGGLFSVTGAYGAGDALPSGLTGAGTRLFFYPQKGAFRAGNVDGTQWDDSNIGSYSAAFGIKTRASGVYGSFAAGDSATASGQSSVAMGNTVTASGAMSTAFGGWAAASGAYSIATGYNTKAQSYADFVVGRYNVGGGSAGSWNSADPVFEIGIGSAGATANAVTVLKNGSVGIGTTSPGYILDVRGGAQFLQSTEGGIAEYVRGASGVSGNMIIQSGAGLAFWQTATIDTLKIGGTGSNEPAVGAINIIWNGNVGIGTISPVNTLDVTGTGIHIADGVPGTPANDLYASGGDLYWNGYPIASGSGGWSGDTITVPYGGTGLTSLTAHGVLVGNGVDPINVTAAGTTGTVFQGVTGSDPAFSANLTYSGFEANTFGASYQPSVATTAAVNLGTSSSVRIVDMGTPAAMTFYGVANGADGRIVRLHNASTQTLTLANQSASDDAANRIITGTGSDLPVPADTSVTMQYDATSSRWRVTGSSNAAKALAAGSDTQVQFNDDGQMAGASGLVWDKTNGRLGIGTTAPEYPFHLYGSTIRALVENPTAGQNAGYKLRAVSAGGTERDAGLYLVAGNTDAATYLGFSANDSTYQLAVTRAGFLGIGTTSPVSSLHVATGGLFSVTGTYGSGDALPAGLTGAGTRMFFYPLKGAFRAGGVEGDQWNNTNVGGYSFAAGYSTTASGYGSTAFGQFTVASGIYSVAMGNSSYATGGYSTALGASTVADAYADVALGAYNVGGGTSGSWVLTDPIFEIGIGTSSGSKANAVTVLKNGLVGIGSTSPAATLDVLSSSTTGNAVAVAGNSVTTGNVLSAASSSLTSGSVSNLVSTSTAGTASGASYVQKLARSGANASGTHTAYGLYSTVTNTGTNATNVGGYFSASGGSNNYGLLVPSGRVGIGTTSPAFPVQVASTLTSTSNRLTIVSGAASYGYTDPGLLSRLSVQPSASPGATNIASITGWTDVPSSAAYASWNMGVHGIVTNESSTNGALMGVVGEVHNTGTTQDITGVYASASTSGNMTGSLIGGEFSPYTSGTTTISGAIGGVHASPSVQNSTVTYGVSGVKANPYISGGSIAYGVAGAMGWPMLDSTTVTSGGVIGLEGGVTVGSSTVTGGAYGVYARVNIGTTSTVDNRYGVYIGDGSGTSTGDDYGLYQAGATHKNYLAGALGIGTLTPANTLDVTGTGIHIADGVPGTPTNDLYASGGDLYWNGYPIASGSGGWTGDTITVPYGGTGLTSLTAHGVLVGNGVDPINVTAAGATGTVFQGVTGSDPVFSANLTYGGFEANTFGTSYQPSAGTTAAVNIGTSSSVRIIDMGTPGAMTFYGVANGADGRIVRLHNASTQTLTLANQSASDDAANRIITGTGSDLPIPADTSVTMQYDATSSRWRVTGSSNAAKALAAGSDTQVQFNDGGQMAGAAGLVWDKTNGRLGIGTTSPAYDFHLVSAAATNVIFARLLGAHGGIEVETNNGYGKLNFLNAAGNSSASLSNTTGGWRWTNNLNISGGASIGTSFVSTAPPTNGAIIQGNVGIGTTSPVSSLQVATGGLLSVTGTVGSGDTLPAGLTGAGTRMFFYPQKAAFRAGGVDGTQWDNASIGNYSTALGYNNTASGQYSVAMGGGSTASGAFAPIAIGWYSTASGDSGIALGNSNNAAGADSIALGYSANAQGSHSIVIGQSSITTGVYSGAIGNNLNVSAYNDIALGRYNVGGGTAGSWVATDPIFEIGIGTAGAAANAVTVLKNGNVGIGTTAPVTTLQVNNPNSSATLTDFTQSLTKSGINIVTNYTSGHHTPGIFWSTSNDNATKPKAGIWMYEGASSSALKFGVSNSYTTGVIDTVMTISGSGRVGIGTTSMGSPLEVYGKAAFSSGGADFSGVMSIAGWSTGALTFPANTYTAQFIGPHGHAWDIGAVASPYSSTNSAIGFLSVANGAPMNYGFYGSPNGDASSSSIAYYASPLGSGVNYALYGNMTAGTSKWGVYITGETKNFFSGSVGIGTLLPANTLDVSGTGIHIADGVPGTPANDLYASGGDLYWNGYPIASGSGGWSGDTITVPYGGTGLTSLTAHGVLVGNGVDPVNVTAAGASGTVFQGVTGSDPAFSANLTYGGFEANTFGASYQPSAATTAAVNIGTSSSVRIIDMGTPAAMTFYGVANGVDGRIVRLHNASTQTLTLANQSASDDAANRIITGTGSDLPIPADTSVTMQYDATSSRWRVTGSSNAAKALAAGSDTQVQFNDGGQMAGAAGLVWDKTNGRLGIGTTSPVSSLQVATGGLFAVTGTYQSGDRLPAGLTGSGSRMFFYPYKGAFRAGIVSGTQWDDANIGYLSTAFGDNVTASGNYAASFGNSNTASGSYSAAFGYYSTASGSVATAIGHGAVATAYNDFAIGQYNVAGGTTDSWVLTDPIFEIGIGTSSSARANALTVLKNGNVGIGTTSPAKNLTIVGSSGSANGIGIGVVNTNSSNTNGWYLSAGGSAVASSAFSISDDNDYKMTFLSNGNVGIGTTSPGNPLHVYSSGAQYSYSTAMVESGAEDGKAALFLKNSEQTWQILNNGATANGLMIYDTANDKWPLTISAGTLDNTIVTNSSGYVGIGTTSPVSALHVATGGLFSVTGTYGSGDSLPVGLTGSGPRMLFYPRKASFRAGAGGSLDDSNIGTYSVAMGESTTASGTRSTAMGAYASASGGYSTAIGYHADAAAYNDVAIGRYNVGGGTADSWVATDPIFEIGIGTAGASANAMTVLKNGNVGIGTTAPTTIFEADTSGTGYTNTWRFSNGNSNQTPSVIVVNNNDDGRAMALGAGTGGAAFTFDTGGNFYIMGDSKANFTNNNLGAGSVLFTILGSNGMVGVGTTLPGSTLDVFGTSGTTLSLRNSGPTASQTKFYSWTDGKTYIQSSGDVLFTAIDSTTLRGLFIGSSGLVGIGTTSPANTLDIGDSGGIHITAGTPSSTANALYNVGGTLYFNGAAVGAGTMGGSGTANYIPKFSAASTLTNSVMYESSGNIGIGTTSPSLPLHIVGTSAPYAAMKIEGAGGTTAGLYAGQVTTNYGYIGSGYYQDSFNWRTGSTAAGNILFNQDGSISFTTNDSLTANTNYTPSTRMTVTSTGNVGIGTASPYSRFEVRSGVDMGLAVMGPDLMSSGVTLLTINDAKDAQVPLELKASTFDFVGGNVGIGTTGPVSSLQVATGGILSVTGTYGSGDTLPSGLTGAGSRMFFYPRKGAFRAGVVEGTQWDDASIGNKSFAVGYLTSASGENGFATGWLTHASGATSTATGYNTTASGQFSTAVGYTTTASGAESTAMGATTTASGDYSLATGFWTTASGVSSTVFGRSATAAAYEDFVLGQYNVGGGTAGSWVATDPIFEIGIGTSSSNKVNAITVLKNGSVGIGTAVPSYPLSVVGNSTYLIYAENSGAGQAIYATSAGGDAIFGGSADDAGVSGYSTNGNGVYGGTPNGNGVYGYSGVGVAGRFVTDTGYALIATGGNVGIGTATPGSTLTVSGTFGVMFAGDNSATGDQLAVATNGGGAIRYTGAGTATFKGLAAGGNGQILYLHNASTYTLTLSNQNTDAAAANRVITGTGADLPIPADSSVSLQYDASAARWRVTGSSNSAKTLAAGADTQVQYNDNGQMAGAASLVYDKTNARTGVGSATPAVTLDVNGPVKVAGTGAETCNSSNIGVIRYNATLRKLQTCYGHSTASFSVAFTTTPIGTSNQTAAAFQFTNAIVGDSFTYQITSSGGGGTASGSGTISSSSQSVTGIDVSALGDGSLALQVSLTTPSAASDGYALANVVKATTLAGCSSVGDTCSDGSIYAGTDSLGVLYAMPCDQGMTGTHNSCSGTRSAITWNDGSANWVASSSWQNSTNGMANTTALYNAGTSTSPAPYFAARSCVALGSNWYLPAKAELALLYTNRTAIGGFSTGGYWSSTEWYNAGSFYERFSDGDVAYVTKSLFYNVRCVHR